MRAGWSSGLDLSGLGAAEGGEVVEIENAGEDLGGIQKVGWSGRGGEDVLIEREEAESVTIERVAFAEDFLIAADDFRGGGRSVRAGDFAEMWRLKDFNLGGGIETSEIRAVIRPDCG